MMEKLETMDEANKVTFIMFDQGARKTHTQVTPSQKLISELNPVLSYGTRYNEPLSYAYTEITASIDKYDRTVLYFMSDGEPEFYPEDEVPKFK